MSELRLFFVLSAAICTCIAITAPLLSYDGGIGLECPIGVVIACGAGLAASEYWDERRGRAEDAP